MARTIRYESEKENDKGIKQSIKRNIKRQRKHVKDLLSVQRFNTFECESLFEDYKY